MQLVSSLVLKCVHFLYLLSSHNFPQKMQSKNLLSDLGLGTLSIHVLFVCIVIFIFFPELWYSEGRASGGGCSSGGPATGWGCQLLLLYFPKLWSTETGDLILILIGFFWIEMRVEILELPASQDIGSLFLWDYHYNTSFSITKQNSFFIQHHMEQDYMGSKSRYRKYSSISRQSTLPCCPLEYQ